LTSGGQPIKLEIGTKFDASSTSALLTLDYWLENDAFKDVGLTRNQALHAWKAWLMRVWRSFFPDAPVFRRGSQTRTSGSRGRQGDDAIQAGGDAHNAAMTDEHDEVVQVSDDEALDGNPEEETVWDEHNEAVQASDDKPLEDIEQEATMWDENDKLVQVSDDEASEGNTYEEAMWDEDDGTIQASYNVSFDDNSLEPAIRDEESDAVQTSNNEEVDGNAEADLLGASRDTLPPKNLTDELYRRRR
jgi:hypothetical protein